MPTISHHELRQLIRSEAIERHLDLAASAARSSEHNGWLKRSQRRLLLLGSAAPVLAVLASMIGSADAVPKIREAAGTLAALPTVATSDPLRSAISPPASSHPRPESPTVDWIFLHGSSVPISSVPARPPNSSIERSIAAIRLNSNRVCANATSATSSLARITVTWRYGPPVASIPALCLRIMLQPLAARPSMASLTKCNKC